jgi:hypothetical protein
LENIYIDFGVTMKLFRMTKICSNESYGKIRVGKYWWRRRRKGGRK